MYRLRYFVLSALIFVSCNCNNSNPDYDSSLPQAPVVPPPQPVLYKVINVYPHDTSSFTQGLEYYKGKLYEGTGELNQSKLRIVDIKTGLPEKSHTISDSTIFGEGITILNNKLYQLTWQNHKIFEYNLNDISKPIRTYDWPHEGWGVTNNGKQLIISDGTPQIYFVTPDETKGQMNITKTLTVRSNQGLMNYLNELELIKGAIYANRWLTNDIMIIDTTNGYVKGIMNFKGIIQQYDPGYTLDEGSVLNGIAYDSTGNRLFITGKDWPKLFEIEIITH